MPKKVKEMSITPQNSSGVKKMKMPGIEKTMKLQENKYNIPTELHRYHKLLRQIVSDYGKEHELFNGVVDFIGDIDTYNEFGKKELAQAKESEMLQYLKNYEVGQQVDKNGELQSANALEKYLPYMDLNESPQKDDYYLLDIPIKYNSKRAQYEMPLPKDIDEQILREFIGELIKEELNDEADLDTRLKKYMENEVPTGDWKSTKNYFLELTQDKPDPKRRYFELVDGFLKTYGY